MWFVLILLTAAVVSAEEKWIGTAPACGGSADDCRAIGWDFVRLDDYGDGAYCFTGKKVLCRKPAHPRPGMWIGTSPVCGGKKEDCYVLDLDYSMSSSTGDGKLCLSGEKVLCRARGNPSEGNKDPKTFNLLSYNIFQRPFIIVHDGQYERTCHIPRSISEKLPFVDAIVFNEAFMQGCRPELPMRLLLTFYGFPHSTKTVGEKGSGVLNGGVFIASRWPIIAQDEAVYKSFTWDEADRLANKGVGYAKIKKFNKMYHVFGTHLQAQLGADNDKVRVDQGREIADFIKAKQIPQTDAVLLGGDLNADSLSKPKHAQDVMNAIGLELPPIIGDLDATADPAINNVVEPGEKKEWLDFVGTIKGYAKPKTGTMEAILLKADKPFTYCDDAPVQPHHVEPVSGWCKATKTTTQLSDHFPVVGKFTFN